MTLWHYTCDHAHAHISDTLRPTIDLVDASKRRLVPWTGELVWLTDMTPPSRDALGLTSNTMHCDRTAHRYQVMDPWPCVPWVKVRRMFDHEQRESIESAPGAMLMHWWVSTDPVLVKYAPL